MIVSNARRRLPSIHVLALTGLTLLTSTGAPAEPDYKPLAGDNQAVAGAFGNLDPSRRRFAILNDTDPRALRVTVLLDGEAEPRELPLHPNAEVWHAGWWGRLDQLAVGDRIWVWLELDRDRQPAAVVLVADEFSQQSFYAPLEITEVSVRGTGQFAMTVKSAMGSNSTERTVALAGAKLYRGAAPAPLGGLTPGEKVYVQTSGQAARVILDAPAFEQRRAGQAVFLRERWAEQGLPGSVVFSHPETREIELMLDHEAMSWARSLRAQDQITLHAAKPVSAVVRRLRPWRERTQLLVSVEGEGPSVFAVGQRVTLQPSALKAENDGFSAGPERRFHGHAEQVEWLVSSVYCPCGMHDDCAGHFLTLAACNVGPVKPCGMALRIRAEIAGMVDKGLPDRQVLETLREHHGPKVLRPHMLP